MVGFPGGVEVERLEIYRPLKGTIFLRTDHHAVAPGNRVADGDWFQDAESHIPVQASFDVVLPVEWDWDG